jgi:hypothetical protein
MREVPPGGRTTTSTRGKPSQGRTGRRSPGLLTVDSLLKIAMKKSILHVELMNVTLS